MLLSFSFFSRVGKRVYTCGEFEIGVPVRTWFHLGRRGYATLAERGSWRAEERAGAFEQVRVH